MGPKTAHNPVTDSDDFVPLQFKPFTGEYSRYAISPELASKKIECVDLLLDTLNGILDTNIPISYPGIQRTLEYLINEGHDLGVIYAYLQVIWPKLGAPLISSKSLTDDNPDYIIRSPELTFRKYEDVDELLSFLNMSFDAEVPRSKLGVEHVLRFFLMEDTNLMTSVLRCVIPDTEIGGEMVQSLEIREDEPWCLGGFPDS